LALKGVSKPLHKFLFLSVISNGWFVYLEFFNNNTNFLALFSFLYIIRRDLLYNFENKEKSLKYYTLNYFLLIFVLSTSPFLVFLLIIYIFQERPIKKMFQKENIKHILLVIVIFLLQNFLFIIYPNLVLDFLIKGSSFEQRLYLLYTKEFLAVEPEYISYIRVISLIIQGITTIFLILNKQLTIDKKFSIFLLVFIFVDCYKWGKPVVSIPFVLLLFTPYLKKFEEGLIYFIKSNIVIFIGIISLFVIYFIPPKYVIC